jgi:small subunit ribosomal protein S6
MIYEVAVLVKPEIGEERLASVKSLVSNLVQEVKGEILIQEDWGVRTFAQPLAGGKRKGHYLYTMYKAGSDANRELDRRLSISEDVMRNLIVKMGPDAVQADLVKKHKNPFNR